MRAPIKMACSVLIILNYIKTCIEVSINLITTFLTMKPALASSVTLSSMSTFRALLRSISCINIVCFNALELSLVFEKFLQLIVTPITVFLSACSVFALLPSHLRNTISSQSSQFLKHKCGSFFQSLNNLFRNAVIYITSKTVLLASYFSKVPFARMSFGLKYSPQTLISLRNLFYVPSTKKSLVTRDSELLDSSVTPHELVVRNGVTNFRLNNNMQVNSVIPDKQVSRASLPREILLEVLGNNQFARFPTFNSGEGCFVPVRVRSGGELHPCLDG